MGIRSRKNKKAVPNANGIEICDSMVMSVKKKNINFRKVQAVGIAIAGFVSAVMSFLTMFDFRYDSTAVLVFAVIFSVLYISLSCGGRRSAWAVAGSLAVMIAVSYNFLEDIATGFKFVCNIIYKDTFHTEINYYKFLNPEYEESSVTILFIFAIWLISAVVYFFTIYHPNPILPLIVTFAPIEAGLYNGIEISVFWGMITVAYWIGLLSMSITDAGEYSGGTGGFVRKENLFFPKRQMKFKVTEKCAVIVMVTVTATALVSSEFMDIMAYRRSDNINKKRVEISDAINSFSLENIAESISDITSAFGLKFEYDTHKLGTIDHMKYKNTTDLEVTFNGLYDGAVYLKEYTGSVYGDNEWTDLPSYDDSIFNYFESSGIYPQNFTARFSSLDTSSSNIDYSMKIKSNVRQSRNFAPYGVDNFSELVYKNDSDVFAKKQSQDIFNYTFRKTDSQAGSQDTVRNMYSTENIDDLFWKNLISDYCNEKNISDYGGYFSLDISAMLSDSTVLYENPEIIMLHLLESGYRDFVYDNYLQLPDDRNMNEIREEYADILEKAKGIRTNEDKLSVLTELRERVAQTVEYSLDPGRTPSNRDFVNYFLLENQKGYCVHYATSGVILARMAGIPARYATGYVIVGDDFNENSLNQDGSYTIDVQDSRGHAWTEIYLDGYGWVPFEFTAGYSETSIEPVTTAPPETESTDLQTSATDDSTQTRDTNTSPSTDVKSSTPSQTTSAVTTVQQETSPAVSTTLGYGVPFFGKGPGKPLPKSVKNTIAVIIFVILGIIFICVRRVVILRLRDRHFSSGVNSRRITNMYSFAEQLLEIVGLERENMQYTDFADSAEQQFSGEYFEKNSFRNLVNSALKASFSTYSPTDEEVTDAEDFVRNFAVKIYSASNLPERVFLRFIRAIV